MIAKKYGIDYPESSGGALTLDPSHVGSHEESGWTIYGEIHEDWVEWINEFEASHPVYGIVKGDFEDVIYAESEEGFNHFCEHHTPTAWDYQDI